MFENSVVESRGGKRKNARAWLFPVSLGFHLLVAAGAMFAAVWSVELPGAPPNQMQAFALAQAVPLPPPPPKGRPDTPEKESVTKPAVTTTPTTVPSAEIIVPQPASANTDVATPGDTESGETGVTDGVVGGDPSSIGLEGPFAENLPATDPIPDTPLRVGGDVRAPVAMSAPAPRFPDPLRAARLSGTVTLECIIDRQGIVRNIRLVKASHPLFASSATSAVSAWRFRPGTLNGRAVDTIYELTVNFSLR